MRRSFLMHSMQVLLWLTSFLHRVQKTDIVTHLFCHQMDFGIYLLSTLRNPGGLVLWHKCFGSNLTSCTPTLFYCKKMLFSSSWKIVLHSVLIRTRSYIIYQWFVLLFQRKSSVHTGSSSQWTMPYRTTCYNPQYVFLLFLIKVRFSKH